MMICKSEFSNLSGMEFPGMQGEGPSDSLDIFYNFQLILTKNQPTKKKQRGKYFLAD